eukprot:31495-Pelagococcus_subviridis.AAC.11
MGTSVQNAPDSSTSAPSRLRMNAATASRTATGSSSPFSGRSRRSPMMPVGPADRKSAFIGQLKGTDAIERALKPSGGGVKNMTRLEFARRVPDRSARAFPRRTRRR